MIYEVPTNHLYSHPIIYVWEENSVVVIVSIKTKRLWVLSSFPQRLCISLHKYKINTLVMITRWVSNEKGGGDYAKNIWSVVANSKLENNDYV